jgi:glucosamine-6-phosphate deaminase
MEVIVQRTPGDMARAAAREVAQVLNAKPNAVLGMATGSTPLGVYQELVRLHRKGELDFSHVTTFNLDEYVGLPAGHEQTYLATIHRELTDGLGLARDRVHGPDPAAEGIATAGARYERLIADAGGVDLQLLGIGSDGHLAFNEPGSSLASRTRIKTLTRRTREDNARFFGSVDEVPVHVLTQGLGTILEARHLILIATGTGKAEAIAAAVEGPLSASCPASVLQLHPHATVVLDEAAAAGLRRAGYYREVYASKPAWQGL